MHSKRNRQHFAIRKAKKLDRLHEEIGVDKKRTGGSGGCLSSCVHLSTPINDHAGHNDELWLIGV